MDARLVSDGDWPTDHGEGGVRLTEWPCIVETEPTPQLHNGFSVSSKVTCRKWQTMKEMQQKEPF